MNSLVFWGVFFLISGGWEASVSEAASASSQEENIYRVLYLNSYHRGHLWSDGIEQGLREGLSVSGKQVDLYVEFLDTQRFPEGEHLAELARTLAVKHRRIRYDVIAASDNNAFDFAIQYRDQLFPGIPLVFCGYNSFRPDVLNGIANVTGINEEIDFQGTIDMALSIHPRTKTLVFVTSDYYSSGQRNQAYAEAVLIPAYREQYDVIQLKNLYMSELEQRLAGLPARSLVFVLGGPMDNRDQEFIPSSEYYRRAAAASTAPAYSFWDFTLNTGMIGGKIITGIEQGRMVAEMALKILDGVRADALAVVMTTPTSQIFDFHALRRFGVSERSLPKGSIVLNRPETFYQKYKRYVLISVFAFITLFTLAASLAYLLRQSRRLETALRQHREHLQEEVAERTAELRQTNKELQARERQFRDLTENIPGVVYQFYARSDGSTGFYYVSPRAKELFGLSNNPSDPDWLLGAKIYPADRERFIASASTAIQERQDWRFEGRLETPLGLKWFQGIAKPTPREHELIFNGVMLDITERKRAEESLAKSNRLLEAVIKQAPFAAHVLEGDINHIHVILENDESKRIMGEMLEGRRNIDANRPETLASRFFTVDGAREIPLAQMPSPRAFQGEIVRNEEFLFRHPDGTKIMVEANASPVYDYAGQIIAIVVTFHDITARKKIEEALRESEEKYRMLIEYSNDVIWTLDLTGQFTYVSPSVFRLRGFTPEEVMQQPIEEAVCPASLPAVQSGFRLAFEVISSGQDTTPPEYFEIEQPRRDGTTVWTEATARLMYNAAGQPIGLVGVSRDISERKRMEAELLRTKEQAETAERLKSTFFANVSHHLRTPLNVILGFADLMAEDATLPATYQEYLALIRQSGKDLLALINQMLTVSKLHPKEIMADESSRQLLDLLEDHRPRATFTPQAEIRLEDIEIDTLRRRMQELPEQIRRRLIDATQKLDIGAMSQIIAQVRRTQPVIADSLERLTWNFEYETLLKLLNPS